MTTKLKKLIIVIEEDGTLNGNGFRIYLDGDKERLGSTKDDDLSPAEFWGKHLFRIVINSVKGAGALKSVNKLVN